MFDTLHTELSHKCSRTDCVFDTVIRHSPQLLLFLLPLPGFQQPRPLTLLLASLTCTSPQLASPHISDTPSTAPTRNRLLECSNIGRVLPLWRQSPSAAAGVSCCYFRFALL